MSPILVVEITYDFGLRIETGAERSLLLYTIYKCTVQYSTQLIEVVSTYNLGLRVETRTERTMI